MSEQEISGTPAQIQAQLEAARVDLGKTVDELADRLSPTKQFAAAKSQVKEKANAAVESLKETATAASEGDSEAIKRVGTIAGGIVAGVAVLAWGLARRRK